MCIDRINLHFNKHNRNKEKDRYGSRPGHKYALCIERPILKSFSSDTNLINDIYDSIKHCINELRKKEKRIVATKNNPASSRSIIVYEFFNVINEDTIVPFILIDLPGREEIKQTYFDEFIVNNPQIIANYENNNFGWCIDRMFASFALSMKPQVLTITKSAPAKVLDVS